MLAAAMEDLTVEDMQDAPIGVATVHEIHDRTIDGIYPAIAVLFCGHLWRRSSFRRSNEIYTSR